MFKSVKKIHIKPFICEISYDTLCYFTVTVDIISSRTIIYDDCNFHGNWKQAKTYYPLKKQWSLCMLPSNAIGELWFTYCSLGGIGEVTAIYYFSDYNNTYKLISRNFLITYHRKTITVCLGFLVYCSILPPSLEASLLIW